jgi:hypothetical protein
MKGFARSSFTGFLQLNERKKPGWQKGAWGERLMLLIHMA